MVSILVIRINLEDPVVVFHSHVFREYIRVAREPFFVWHETKQLFLSNGINTLYELGSKDWALVMGINSLT